ncbi:TPA: ImmA/IrrE family metallo-endopeptidase [Vibrio cholerae O1]|uniref:ImmA/IrrE family metallo-endopeptidase n=1 Tax=Vibrio cholerae TaxID=666 RepID=UPI000345BB48|nr:ImmA/IrrE family metallo-endopeptidase [Vibrio cholerae]HAS2376687.1 ImmA/IrrE family metallo-endopeptidase [Vibrio cholerae O1]EGR2396443.1 ImmA/IrrE family metallo-endopeptidase [Vibrio cholerae]EGR2399006.1 ImmA/IrrE family metallo-endopeptidase [Vibrio cholerae]EGR4180635.1 ImmA/IrrE family metallo-endopeptidase [Vibrio cholerae]EGR4193256.1 ImmA/IrrE family metallo-endopeptidase [Vibrio cholerae]
MNNENHLNKYSDCSFDSFYERYKKARNRFLESDIKLSECEKKFKLVDIFNNLDKDGDVLYRKNKLASDSKVFSWISSLRNKASIIQAYNNLEYKGINKQDILELVTLSKDINSIKLIPNKLLSCGIILVYEKYIPGMKLDGALYKNSSGTPVIGISFRYKRVDSFWFTLVHELSHVILHYDLIDRIIIDDFDDNMECHLESEANRLTRDLLIPKHAWRSSDARINKTEQSVHFLADKLNIHPAIIAGRIRFENNNYTILNKIENKITSDDF